MIDEGKPADWRVALVGKWCLHAPTRVVGKVEKFFTGEEGDCFISPVNDAPVKGPVLLFESKHTINAIEEEHFIELEPREVSYYLAAQTAMRGFLVEVAKYGQAAGLTMGAGHLLLLSVIEAQLDALKATQKAPEIMW